MSRVAIVVLVVVVAAVALFVLWPRPDSDVTLYCSVDQDHSLSIVADFERETGRKVRFQGDTEASKSVGVAQRLFHERENPAADVLWANEPVNTAYLAKAGVLAPLPASVAKDLPASMRDPEGRWVAFAARARVILVNRALLPDETQWPTKVSDLLDERWGGPGRAATVARPVTGTTFSHAAALLTRDEAAGRAFWEAVAAREGKGVLVVQSNGAVMNQVSDAKNGVAWGLTDTDDARVAIERGDPVSVVYPDQEEGGVGTLVLPNTAALVAGGPNPEEGERLLRWLVSADVERRLAAGPSAQIPLRPEVEAPPHVRRPGPGLRTMSVDWSAVGEKREQWLGWLQSVFQRR
jgi:iron(III) transport system substrate-binding protein